MLHAFRALTFLNIYILHIHIIIKTTLINYSRIQSIYRRSSISNFPRNQKQSLSLPLSLFLSLPRLLTAVDKSVPFVTRNSHRRPANPSPAIRDRIVVNRFQSSHASPVRSTLILIILYIHSDSTDVARHRPRGWARKKGEKSRESNLRLIPRRAFPKENNPMR